MNCPVCNSDTTAGYCPVNGYDSRRCTSCGHIFVENAVESVGAELYGRKFYENYMSGMGYHEAYRKYLLADFRKKISLMRTFLDEDSSVLEVGCGPGYFAEMMESEGYEVTGVELNNGCINYAKEHNISFTNFVCEDISRSDSSISGKQYDSVVSWATIEHVRDVNEYVQLLKRYTVSKGYIFVDTGVVNRLVLAFDSGYTSWLFPPYHLHVFSEGSLKRIMRNNGLDIVYFDHWFNNHYRIKALRWLLLTRLLAKKVCSMRRIMSEKKKPGGLARIGLIVCRKPGD